MKRTGAWIAVRALEALGIKYTFGIPGVHNTELYDELNSSEHITPVLVTHEGGAAFMADGMSRTSGLTGTLVIVPAAVAPRLKIETMALSSHWKLPRYQPPIKCIRPA